MGQPGMRVTVDAAMRARDVSRPWPDDGPAGGRAAAGEPATADDNHRNGGPDRADRSRTDRDRDDRSQRERPGKAERRRLSKRHARAGR